MLAIEKDRELFVGKVTTIGRSTIAMVMYTGTPGGCWEPMKSAHGNNYVNEFPKDCVKDDMIFYLTAPGKLPVATRAKISKLLK